MTPNYENRNDLHDEPETADGFHFYYLILLFYLVCPLVVILNLILFFKIVLTKKIRSEPWRWLVANNSFCMICTAILGWNRSLTSLYFVSSLLSKPVCYFFSLFETSTWAMTLVTSTLIITERFHGLRRGVQNGGSFSKKQVILCLVPFWILATLGPAVLSIIIVKDGYSLIYTDDKDLCHLWHKILRITPMFMWIWAFPAFIVVFIGTLVLKGRTTTTDSMKQSIVNPTLALCCCGFILLLLPITLLTGDMIFVYLSKSGAVDFLALLTYMNSIAFPIIWLLTWSRIGDISLKCGKVGAG